MTLHAVLRVLIRVAVPAAVATVALATYVLFPPAMRRVEFPDGKHFALSIVDDTDLTTLERVRPLYDVMYRAGLRTTKTVWVLEQSDEPVSTNQGATLRDTEYLAWILDLQRKGFEIALHGVRGGSSERATVLEGLDEFRRLPGADPRLHVNHALNRENLYWGEHRWWFTPYRWLFRLTRPQEFRGEQPDSPYFWGDLAQRRIRYVRRFTFSEINLLRTSPSMPYRVPGMPYVNYWFETSDGGSIEQFDRLLSDENLDRLEREGGVTLIYAHLGAGSFNVGGRGKPDPRFVARIEAVSKRNGWFAPASDILDHLARQAGWTPELSAREHLRLDSWFLLDRVF